MKLLHLADLHLGIRLYDFSLIEDQRAILRQIIDLAKDRKPDVLLIAGDVYDRSMPSIEAVSLFDEFLTEWSEIKKPVILIAGNHDSAPRLTFGGRIFERNEIHFAPPFDGTIHPIRLEDADGPVVFWPIPYLNASSVRPFFSENVIKDEADAFRAVTASLPLDPDVRNVAIAHQFVEQARRSDSEETLIGGLGAVPVSAFDPFDYTALGHLHHPQTVGGRKTARYAGSPLKYSFSEAEGNKSVTWIELGNNGNVKVEEIPLTPIRDLRTWTGTWEEWLAHPEKTDDWIGVTLTEEMAIPDLFIQIRQTCPHLLRIDYDNLRTQNREPSEPLESENRSPLERFDEMFERCYGRPLDDFQRSFADELIRQIWNGEERSE